MKYPKPHLHSQAEAVSRLRCLRKPAPTKNFLHSTRGQGLVEYLLMMVLVVGIILGIVVQFNRAVALWANAYFGDYLACLLETGELPIIGGNGDPQGDPGANLTCDAFFEEFTFTAGRPPVTGPASAGSSGSSGSNGSNAPSGGSGSRGADGAGREERVATNSQAGGAGGGGRFGGNNRGGRGSDAGSSFEAGLPGQDKDQNDTATLAAARMGQGRSSTISRDRIELGYGSSSDEEDNGSSSNISSRPQNNKRKSPTRLLANSSIKKQTDLGPDEPWTFGDFLRYLLIIAMILAILLVLGGQGLQISRGMEN